MLDSVLRARQIAVLIVMIFTGFSYVGYYALLYNYEKIESAAYVRTIELSIELANEKNKSRLER